MGWDADDDLQLEAESLHRADLGKSRLALRNTLFPRHVSTQQQDRLRQKAEAREQKLRRRHRLEMRHLRMFHTFGEWHGTPYYEARWDERHCRLWGDSRCAYFPRGPCPWDQHPAHLLTKGEKYLGSEKSITTLNCVCAVCEARCANRPLAGKELCGPCSEGVHAGALEREDAA